MLKTSLLAALGVGGIAAMGTMVNEGTHGDVAEMMGFGHHHMADYGGYHCASHMGEEGDEHFRHMHEDHETRHDDCPGGGDMHDMDHPMMPGGMM